MDWEKFSFSDSFYRDTVQEVLAAPSRVALYYALLGFLLKLATELVSASVLNTHSIHFYDVDCLGGSSAIEPRLNFKHQMAIYFTWVLAISDAANRQFLTNPIYGRLVAYVPAVRIAKQRWQEAGKQDEGPSS
jgi:hypothetical protein